MDFHPWRRFLARSFDIFICNVLWMLFLIFAFNVNMIARSSMAMLFDSFMGFAIMLFTEPLCLSLFRTTPGKLIFSFRVEAQGGRRLTYREGLERTWHVIGGGLGYNIPIYNYVRLWKSYKSYNENGILPWDACMSNAYTIKDTKGYRGVLLVGSYAAIAAVLIVAMLYQLLPPNRGELTIPEFVENYNYYADYLNIDFDNHHLNEKGQWVETESDEGVYVINFSYNKMPEYEYIVDNGHVTGVSFIVEIKNGEEWISSYKTHMILAALSLVGAQKETGLFSLVPNRLVSQIHHNTFKDFSFVQSGIELVCDMEYSGYESTSDGFLIPDQHGKNYFKLHFSANRLQH